MTAKEKAKELISIYFRTLPQHEVISETDGIKFSDWNRTEHLNYSKKCALILIEEQIKLLEYCYGSQKYMWTSHENETHSYLQNVKQYICSVINR